MEFILVCTSGNYKCFEKPLDFHDFHRPSFLSSEAYLMHRHNQKIIIYAEKNSRTTKLSKFGSQDDLKSYL